jgi:hypothetical protein
MKIILVAFGLIGAWLATTAVADAGSVTMRKAQCFVTNGKEYCRFKGSANCDRGEKQNSEMVGPLPMGKKVIGRTGRGVQTEVHNTGSVRFITYLNIQKLKRSEIVCKFYCNAGFEDSFVIGYCQVQVEPWR